MKYSKEIVIISTRYVSDITCDRTNVKVEMAFNLEIAADKLMQLKVVLELLFIQRDGIKRRHKAKFPLATP